MSKFSLTYRVMVMLALAAMLSACGPYIFRSGALIEPPNPATDFTLLDSDGQPFQLSQQRSKLTLMFFGFTNCPDVCPTTLADMKAVRERLGADANKTQFIMITVDPERDTPERMGRYVKSFDPSFIGLHGTQEQLAQIYKAYGVTAIRRELPNSALKYTMDHSASVYVIDKGQQWRAQLMYGSAIDDLVSDIRYLIRSGGY